MNIQYVTWIQILCNQKRNPQGDAGHRCPPSVAEWSVKSAQHNTVQGHEASTYWSWSEVLVHTHREIGRVSKIIVSGTELGELIKAEGLG